MMATSFIEGEDATSSGSSESFESAFGPLAHHLFPDGCPQHGLDSVWPARTDRAPVSLSDALVSLQATAQVATTTRLTAEQLSAVTLVTCATLPGATRITSATANNSPLVDGSSRYFCSLVMNCMLPQQQIPKDVICQLLSLPSLDTVGKSTVLRFLTLAVHYDYSQARQMLQKEALLYGILLSQALQPETCVDAVRLLLILTQRQHVTQVRVRRLVRCYQRHSQRQNEDNDSSQQQHVSTIRSALAALLQLYAEYEPQQCEPYWTALPPMSYDYYSLWRAFPDTAWEQRFLKEKTHHHGSSSQQQRPCKRARRILFDNNTLSSSCHSSLTRVMNLDELFDFLLDNNHPKVVPTLWMMNNEDEIRQLRFNLPFWLRHAWYPQSSSFVVDAAKRPPSSAPGVVVDSNNIKKRRDHVVLVLEALAVQMDGLVPEARDFVVEHMLPQWDGDTTQRQYDDDGGRTTSIRLLDVLVFLEPTTNVVSFADFKRRVLPFLEPLLLYGSAQTQYDIVSGLLAGWVKRWGRRHVRLGENPPEKGMTDEAMIQDDQNNDKNSVIKTLRELIQWTDDLLIKTILLSVSGEDELLRAATVDFFEAVCDLTEHLGSFLAAPSPSLCYRLLLSKSVLHIDRVCQLLVQYRAMFQKLKEHQTEGTDDQDDAVSATERIKVFNCFVWDFCSVLWRCSPPPSPDARGQEEHTLSILFTELRRETQSGLFEVADRVASSLSITHGAAFAGFAPDFLLIHFPDKDALSPDLIRGKVKVKYLEYLKSRGMSGIYEFLSTFIGSLASRRRRAAS